MAAVRHRWSAGVADGKAGKCERCKLKTAVKKVPDPRPGRKGKLAQQHFFVGGKWQRDMPTCTGGAQA